MQDTLSLRHCYRFGVDVRLWLTEGIEFAAVVYVATFERKSIHFDKLGHAIKLLDQDISEVNFQLSMRKLLDC